MNLKLSIFQIAVATFPLPEEFKMRNELLNAHMVKYSLVFLFLKLTYILSDFI